MNAWPFVIAAYAFTIGGTGTLVIWAWRSMREAEAQAESLKRHA